VLDLYCERTGPGLFSEPVNALSNLAFFLAAWAAWRLARRTHTLTADTVWLVVLALAIGIGSTLFHSYATAWARILDEVPILAFQLCYVWLYLRQIMRVRRRNATLAIAAYLAAAILARRYPHLLNGSLVYAPALFLLLALGFHHFLRQQHERGLLLAAATVFMASLVFRIIDEAICTGFAIGTHFLWHLLNAVVLYLSMRALLVDRRNLRSD
jgi:Ceramidase